jgi:arabinofuranosyltransferase
MSERSRASIVASLLGAVAVHLVRALPTAPSVVDDAWISARYARNLALGHGLVYNVGEAPVEGYTNLAFVALLAVAHRAGLEMHTAMVSLGLVFSSLGLVASFGVARALGVPSGWALIPPFLLALDAHYAVVATNGIESSMFVASVLAATWAVLREQRGLAAILLALLVTVRPEGIAVAGGLCAFELARSWPHVSRALPLALGTVAAAIPTWLGRKLYFGAWVPNTFAAKDHRELADQLAFNLRYLGPDAPFWITVALLFAFACTRIRRDLRRAIVAALAAGLIAIAFRVDMWMPGGRLLLPAVALILPLATAAMADGAQGLGVRSRIAIIALVGLGVTVGPVPDHVREYDRRHTALPGNPAEKAAQWLGEHAPPGATLATRDAGVLAYHVGPNVRIAELHQRALTRPHPGGVDAQISTYTPKNPEFFIATVQREAQVNSGYSTDRLVFRGLDQPYRYLGRVLQHYHRYYDVYVRADLQVPDLPASWVVNAKGPQPPVAATPRPSAQ